MRRISTSWVKPSRGNSLCRAVLRILRNHCDNPISIDGILEEKEELKLCYTVTRFINRKPLSYEDMEKARQTIKNAMNTIRRKGHDISSIKIDGQQHYCCA